EAAIQETQDERPHRLTAKILLVPVATPDAGRIHRLLTPSRSFTYFPRSPGFGSEARLNISSRDEPSTRPPSLLVKVTRRRYMPGRVTANRSLRSISKAVNASVGASVRASLSGFRWPISRAVISVQRGF